MIEVSVNIIDSFVLRRSQGPSNNWTLGEMEFKADEKREELTIY